MTEQIDKDMEAATQALMALYDRDLEIDEELYEVNHGDQNLIDSIRRDHWKLELKAKMAEPLDNNRGKLLREE